jgi:hypothetical protein
MKRLLVLSIFILLAGCATPPKPMLVREPIIIPPPPKAVILESKGINKSDYPEARWVKKPDVDLKKQIACWSYADIESISNYVQECRDWSKVVDQTIAAHNTKANADKLLQEKVKPKPWYRFW